MSGGNFNPRPHLKDVTLVCVDTTEKAHLGARAIEKSLEQASFGAVKMLTHDLTLPHAVKIRPIDGMADYSRFMIRELHEHVQTSHCLVVQWDGHVLNGKAWTDHFLEFDYGGPPWEQWQQVGNGGFSLRSQKLLRLCSTLAPHETPHPEDAWICTHQRQNLERAGMKFMPVPLARQFGFEGRGYNGTEWKGSPVPYNGSFGFHSYLSPLPAHLDRPLVFHHSGDSGDVVYSLAVAKALGGGTYFVSTDCKHPYPKAPKLCAAGDAVAFRENVGPLLRRQPYIWHCQETAATPFSTDIDFNEFRLAYRRGGAENWKSLVQLHAQTFGVEWDGQPWLECSDPVSVPGRPIVVNKTQRYTDDRFPWWELIKKYGHQMVFIGTPEEHELFCGYAPELKIPRHPTGDLWDVARVIRGSKVFIGNQSCPLAVAHGLGHNVIVQEWPANRNCHLERSNAIYWTGGEIEIPGEWLQ